MPPSGKMTASTAALRTTSTILAMSTWPSRLAEYSIVKCGIAVSLPVVFLSAEVAAHRAVGAIVGLDCVALAGLDRTDERAGQHDLTGFERQPVRCDLVGEPRNCSRGMVEDTGGEARLFELAVLEAERADPAQVSLRGADRPAAQHDAGI